MSPSSPPPPEDGSLRHHVVTISELEQQRGDRNWHQFLKTPALYTGLYVLPAGSEDRQQPHAHDEIYYVLRGKASVSLGEEKQLTPVEEGAVVFVRAGVDHRFQDIEEDLHLLVFFSTAEAQHTEQN